MTYKPGSMGQQAWDRFVQIHPKRDDETMSQWMQRLIDLADGKLPKVERDTRLPYAESRDPGEEG